MKYIYYGRELYHHGIKGQKWGERNYQNEDGSLTPEGRKRYGYSDKVANYKALKIAANNAYKKVGEHGLKKSSNYHNKKMLEDNENAAYLDRLAKKAYKETGRNFIERKMNNKKYSDILPNLIKKDGSDDYKEINRLIDKYGKLNELLDPEAHTTGGKEHYEEVLLKRKLDKMTPHERAQYDFKHQPNI